MRFKRLLLSLFLMFAFLFTACSQEDSLFPDTQKLRLEVIPGNQFGALLLDDSISADLVHVTAVSDVSIYINDKKHLLTDALNSNLITADELEAYAQIDAKLGHCQMEWAERCGLSMYVYHYSDYDLVSYYDIFLKPDGSKEHIQKVIISGGNQYHNVNDSTVSFPEWVREDWGISFTVTEAAPDHVTLLLKQTGGQHFGTLSIGPGFTLYHKSADALPQIYYDTTAQYLPGENCGIGNNSTTEITISWPAACGTLPEGEYSLHIQIIDSFQDEQIHPFTKDYNTQQYYEIDFSISTLNSNDT